MGEPQPGAELKRTIGVFALACTVVNITIGTGIFVLPALVAEHLGAAAIICFFICGFVIFLIGLCFAEVGTKITGTGGTYVYIETAFGPFAGFMANNIFWFGSAIFSDAAVANGLTQTLGYFFPWIGSFGIRALFLLVLFGGLAFINIRGTKNGVKVIILTTLAKLIPLLLIIIFGVGHIVATNLQWKIAFSFNDIGSTTLILFFAFVGIESALSSSGEIKDPPKVVPVGILSGLLVILLLYVSIQLVSQGILGNELVLYKDAPLAEVSKRLFGFIGISLVTIGIAFSMLGTLSSEILAIPRVLFAGARDGIFPAFLGKVHPKYFTPYKAIALYAGIGYLIALFGSLKQLAILSSASTLLIYLGVVLATIRLRYTKVATAKTCRVPGGLVIPILASVLIIWILSNLSKEEMIGIGISMLVLSLIYVVMEWVKRKQKGNKVKN